jgi:hypothetical protein
MKREIYLWIALIVVVALAALGFRYLYQAPISLSLSMNGSAARSALYPYQNAALPIVIQNTGGSAVTNMSIGIIINGNLTSLYKVTLPAGKQTMIPFNYSPVTPGTFNITAVADPSRLYPITNRAGTASGATLTVLVPANAAPYGMLPSANLTSLQSANLRRGGYAVDAYINSSFSTGAFAVIGNWAINNFLGPILNLTTYYTYNMTIANAKYVNGDRAYSIWTQGYTSPSIVADAASAAGLTSQRIRTSFGNMTLVKISNGTTLCSWYSGGWLKMLAYVGSRTCYQAINASAGGAVTGAAYSALYPKVVLKNVSQFANYTGRMGSVTYAATLSMLGSGSNSSFVYARISNNTAVDNICNGVITNISNRYYCSTYLFPNSGSTSGISLIRTTSYAGTYNLTVMSLVNTSHILPQVQTNINIINSFNFSGMSFRFKSGLVNTCTFNASFPCANVTFSNGQLTFRLTDNMSSGIRLNRVACYSYGVANQTPVGATLAAGAAANFTVPCYSFGGIIPGIPLNLNLNLLLNYSVSNSMKTLAGRAYILIG